MIKRLIAVAMLLSVWCNTALFAQSNPTFVSLTLPERATHDNVINLIEHYYTFPKNGLLEETQHFGSQPGWRHHRFALVLNQFPVDDAIITVHERNGLVETISGFAPSPVQFENASHTLTVTAIDAFIGALEFVNAEQYAWQDTHWEQRIQSQTDDSLATWLPVAEIMYAPRNGDYRRDKYTLAYRFDIYAVKPWSRQFVYVDAQTGDVMFTENRICEIDVTGTAVTAYSGAQTITTDQFAGGYRLRESGRGNGIETYNMLTGTNPGAAVDFTDADNYWNNINAQGDHYATDAHWGTEITYDYFMAVHGRNSVDGNGLKLVSYVHEDVNLFNAFWDGGAAHYGDGNNSTNPLTCLDIVAHELTHGVTQFTAGLNYQNESGALNESFSDIFGVAIEFGFHPNGGNFQIGEQTGMTIRSISNPNAFSDPDTYGGLHWYTGSADNGGVHTNSGVQNFWFYLLVQGGAGTNDLGNPYIVTSIGMQKATAVAYRALSVYLFPTAQYLDARVASVQAAVDLYGPCSPEVESVSNAWHAVGVGGAYVPVVTAAFTAMTTTFCAPPAVVSFVNQSVNAGQFTWHFGDGNTSTDASPQHVYSQFGTYSVMLQASGGACGADTINLVNYILIDSLVPCLYTMLTSGSTSFMQCSGTLYDSGGPNGNYPDNHNSIALIAPPGATGLALSFDQFYLESNYDYLYLYNGPGTSSPIIGVYSGSSLPNGGNTINAGPVVTVRMTSDVGLNHAGFKMNWQCVTAPPQPVFVANHTASCSGWIQFTDLSLNAPTSWLWNFGDGQTSTEQHPTHFYQQEGTYTVSLAADNIYGTNAAAYTNYITVDRPAGPVVTNGSSCTSANVSLSAIATGSTNNIHWYDNALSTNPVDSGVLFTTPLLASSAVYWVEEIINYPVLNGGLPDNSLSGGNFNNATDRYLVFSVYQPITLVSVKVYAQGGATRTIQLRDAQNVVLQSTTVFIPNGENTVTLNFDLPAQNNLRLAIGGTANLFRNDGSATFPYTVPGVLSITGSNATPAGYYYYFYDWRLQLPSCISERVPVTATLGQAPVTIEPSNNVVMCDNSLTSVTASGGVSYEWSTGSTNASIVPQASGAYSVTLTSADGCTGNGTVNVQIQATPASTFTLSMNGSTATFQNTSTGASLFQWFFGDGQSSTQESPTHSYLSGGLYTVTLIASNGTCADTSQLTVEVFTGINEVNESSVVLYPNPADGFTLLEIQHPLDNATVTICDALGRVVQFREITLSQTRLVTSEMAAGVYSLTARSGTLSRTLKLVVQR